MAEDIRPFMQQNPGPYPFAPSRPRVVRPDLSEIEEAIAAPEVERIAPPPPPPAPRKRTDIEQAAFWIDHWRHLDLKKVCTDITGNEDEAKKLADQMAKWAEATVEAALKDGAPA